MVAPDDRANTKYGQEAHEQVVSDKAIESDSEVVL
jgi:hypothetical protein